MTLAELEVLKCQSSIVKIRRECLFLADCYVCDWVANSRAASLRYQLKAGSPHELDDEIIRKHELK